MAGFSCRERNRESINRVILSFDSLQSDCQILLALGVNNYYVDSQVSVPSLSPRQGPLHKWSQAELHSMIRGVFTFESFKFNKKL